MSALLLGVALISVACGVSADPGLTATLRVKGAQFVPGAFPAPTDGPPVLRVQLGRTHIRAGSIDEPLLGELSRETLSVVVGLVGDRGYWVVVAGLPDTQAPSSPTLRAELSLSVDAPPGPTALNVAAVDASGHIGPASVVAMTVVGAARPAGELVVHLAWDRPADLDLRLILPSGAEIWSRSPSAYQPPPPPALPDFEQARQAGGLDLDSNGGCVVDGRNQENIVLMRAPAPGRYVVRVDVPSLCGEPFANWRVELWRTGRLLREAAGQVGPTDTRGVHDRGAGRTALELEVP